MKHFFVCLSLLLLTSLAQQAIAQATLATRKSLVSDEPATRRSGKKKASDAEIARMQQRMSMNSDEAKRDKQMEILEARSGMGSNTSFSRGSNSARQYDSRNGGFTVKKFKTKNVGSLRQKRGQTHAAPGIDPKGKPLKHKHKKRFLFF
ncbi:hypothetical protein [Hymenobacter defluvii]|uniref:DUF4890 domain-containing protein n=1 Tax=Hymenobacter defluvii TaxID=2054411 RepID=A0ABS3T8G6_9BACT|nr:hypothetical protein [Hymenobacter defluvii]MBO3269935.1 hypothetical protein [Hymenobacter defluvii]